MTEERCRASALRDAQASLRQAQKMEAVGQLTGGIAHDFNNLIGGISGLVDLARTRIVQQKPQDATSLLDAAEAAIDKAAALTHRLLAFSRKQTLQPKQMNVARQIEGFLDLIRRSIGPTMNVEFTCECPALTIFADDNQFENALLNLCLNARDAMPRGGTITITSHRETSAQASDDEQYVAISVADTGIGMTADVAERAIEPFFTTKPVGAGTGLGLSMAYGFVEQSGGTLSITSQPGSGTCVQMLFPAGPLPAQSEASPAKPGLPHRASVWC
ncbi:sensor histidine kinase [Falsirhodobacter xinxiangensis]|uniref:sensor histidine kinase n=1 Tax=Falsirhodobacter xinxiangensis TaxID=2530049 RepID=UPI0010AB26D7|nr:ATP-binding protein [Rhodobacter xinxiangensis]